MYVRVSLGLRSLGAWAKSERHAVVCPDHELWHPTFSGARSLHALTIPTTLLDAVWISGLVQTGLYADFFYYYFLCWKNNQKLVLPA